VRVLGIETSCDETGLAIYDGKLGLIANQLYSQIKLHQQFGGVVPELASRDHIKYLIPLTRQALEQADCDLNSINAIAYTAGPGLVGALLTGASFAKGLSYALNIPCLAVHHLEAHLLAAQIDITTLQFPFLVLLVSGGHTQLLAAHQLGEYELLGDTLDDAVGEAFDKTAKLMGLDYPGGPKLAKLADSIATEQLKLPAFPRPMTDRPGLNFSFSGLKTHALTVWNKSAKNDEARIAIAKAFQEAVIETLIIKCKRAIGQTDLKQLVIAGGVGANLALRNALTGLMTDLGGAVYFPKIEYCTDNGAMIAYAGYLHLNRGKEDHDLSIVVKARWPLA
jgi:N6-L-threonylcarbamoyladenine synthase